MSRTGQINCRQIQGLPLTLGPFVGAALTPTVEPFRFFSASAALPIPPLPAGQAPLQHLRSGEAQPVLLLRPSSHGALSEEQACGLQAALRPGAAELAHREGHLSVERHQGVWLLQLAGSHGLICHGLNVVNRALAVPSPAVINEAARNLRHAQLKQQNDIAIRRLLAQLPAALNVSTATAPHWHATLVGGDGELKRRLSHLLYDFPYAITAEPQTPPRLHPPVTLTESGAER